MRVSSVVTALLAGVFGLSAPTWAQDFRDLAPNRLWDGKHWIAAELPDLDSPEIQRQIKNGRLEINIQSLQADYPGAAGIDALVENWRTEFGTNHIQPNLSFKKPVYYQESKEQAVAWVDKNGWPGQFSALNFSADLWGLQTKRQIVMAVIDSSFMLDHPAMQGKWHVNRREIPGNGIDDDQNGIIDDHIGYDFAENDPDPNPDIACPFSAHGTHVAGLVAARDYDVIGLKAKGVAPSVKIMPLKVEDSKDNCHLHSLGVSRAILYAIDNGADIINMSLGGPGDSPLDRFMMRYAAMRNVLIVTSAGNEGVDTDYAYRPDGTIKRFIHVGPERALHYGSFSPTYPASYDQDYGNVVSVAASAHYDPDDLVIWGKAYGYPQHEWETIAEKWEFDVNFDPIRGTGRRVGDYVGSNYGPRSVSVMAPGDKVIAPVPLFDGERFHAFNLPMSGTSMASPITAGVAAWLWGQFPDATAVMLKQVLIKSSRPSDKVAGKIVSGGRVDVAAAYQMMQKLMQMGDIAQAEQAVLAYQPAHMQASARAASPAAPASTQQDRRSVINNRPTRQQLLAQERQSGALAQLLTLQQQQGTAQPSNGLAATASRQGGHFLDAERSPQQPAATALKTRPAPQSWTGSDQGDLLNGDPVTVKVTGIEGGRRFDKATEERLNAMLPNLHDAGRQGHRVLIGGQMAELATDFFVGMGDLDPRLFVPDRQNRVQPGVIRLQVAP